MLKRIGTTVLTGLAILFIGAASQAQSNLTAKSRGFRAQPVSAVVESDRIKDGLVGPVRRVRTEIVKLAAHGWQNCRRQARAARGRLL